jgi:hypothetical protein
MAVFYCLRFETPHTWKARSHIYLGVEVLTAVVMKNTVVWDMTPFSLLKVERGHGGANASVFRIE